MIPRVRGNAWFTEIARLSILMPPALVVIMGIDAQIRGDESLLVHGVADEVAHLLTAIVCVASIRAFGIPAHWAAALVGSVMLDLDHIPVLLDLVEAVPGSSRPGTHGLAAALPVLALGLAIPPWRFALWSLGFGILTHLFRDAATGYVPLAWPLFNHPVHVHYAVYLAALVILAMVTVRTAVTPLHQGSP